MEAWLLINSAPLLSCPQKMEMGLKASSFLSWLDFSGGQPQSRNPARVPSLEEKILLSPRDLGALCQKARSKTKY